MTRVKNTMAKQCKIYYPVALWCMSLCTKFCTLYNVKLLTLPMAGSQAGCRAPQHHCWSPPCPHFTITGNGTFSMKAVMRVATDCLKDNHQYSLTIPDVQASLVIIPYLLDYFHQHACILSCFSPVGLLATPWTAARQAPLSIGILQARILEWVAMPSSRNARITSCCNTCHLKN